MRIYLKALCILSRKICVALWGPLSAILVLAPLVLVPYGEGLLLRLVFPDAFSIKALSWGAANPWMYWVKLWFAGLFSNVPIVIAGILIERGALLWLDALNEARKPSGRCVSNPPYQKKD